MGVTAVIRVGFGEAESMLVTRGSIGAAWKWPSCPPGQPALPYGQRKEEVSEGRGIGRKGENKMVRIIDSAHVLYIRPQTKHFMYLRAANDFSLLGPGRLICRPGL